jgi:hypothetical protein
MIQNEDAKCTEHNTYFMYNICVYTEISFHFIHSHSFVNIDLNEQKNFF